MREYKFWLMVYACLVDVVSAAGHSRAIDDGNAPLDEDHAEGAASLVQAKAGHVVGVIHLHDKTAVYDDSGVTESDHDTSTLEVGVTGIDKAQIDAAIHMVAGDARLSGSGVFQSIPRAGTIFNVFTSVAGPSVFDIVAITSPEGHEREFYVQIFNLPGSRPRYPVDRSGSLVGPIFRGGEQQWRAVLEQVGITLPSESSDGHSEFEYILLDALRSPQISGILVNLLPEHLPDGIHQIGQGGGGEFEGNKFASGEMGGNDNNAAEVLSSLAGTLEFHSEESISH